MLFNSCQFIFLFLPLLLLAHRIVAQTARDGIPLLLLVASLVFYAPWGTGFLVLLLCTICVNCAFGYLLDAMPDSGEGGPTRKHVLTLAVIINLAPLCWFKYANFLIDNINAALGTGFAQQAAGLPPGISFYTLLQVAYLVTIYRRRAAPAGLFAYAGFASFFPCVLSGPIVRYPRFGPMLAAPETPSAADVARALTFLVIGLAKKTLLADGVAPCANSVFNAAEKGLPLTGAEAWAGSLAYTFQVYFDFSGYTDMAIGAALLFGLRLPDNFDSPYKSTDIIDFWRRWHITLSLWLRDFLYIPLGGSRAGRLRQYRNLLVTMLLGGLWHGAGWTFILWGGLHGLMLCVNHFWKARIGDRVPAAALRNPAKIFSIAFTFVCVNLAWVLFRADTLRGAGAVYEAMARVVPTDFSEGMQSLFANNHVDGTALALLGASALLVWGFPPTRRLVEGFGTDGTPVRPAWKPNARWAAALAFLAFASLLFLSRGSAFLFQF